MKPENTRCRQCGSETVRVYRSARGERVCPTYSSVAPEQGSRAEPEQAQVSLRSWACYQILFGFALVVGFLIWAVSSGALMNALTGIYRFLQAPIGIKPG